MLNIADIEPEKITAGDTITWNRHLPDFPASEGWMLNYSALSLAGSIQIPAVASGDDYLITIDMSVSALYIPGTYNWQSWVTNGVERYPIGRGVIVVAPDYSVYDMAGLDTRSHVKRVLDAIEAVIEGRASVGDQQLTVDGTTLIKMTASELLTLRFRYKSEYKKELQADRAASGKSSGRKIVTRFIR